MPRPPGKYPLKNGRAKKIISSLKSIMPASSSDPPPATTGSASGELSLIPIDGVYTATQLCRILNITRQNLGYHTNKKHPRKRLYYVRKLDDPAFYKKRGAKPFYVTAIEFYRFLIVNSYPVPPSVTRAIENYNKYYGMADWEKFKKYFQSNNAGLQQAITDDFVPPEQGRVLPPPAATPSLFSNVEPKIALADSALPPLS